MKLIYYEYTPHEFCDVWVTWITIVTSIQCILKSTRDDNIRSENVMLLMAVSNTKGEGRHMKFSEAQHAFLLSGREKCVKEVT